VLPRAQGGKVLVVVVLVVSSRRGGGGGRHTNKNTQLRALLVLAAAQAWNQRTHSALESYPRRDPHVRLYSRSSSLPRTLPRRRLHRRAPLPLARSPFRRRVYRLRYK
jgi:hypothetical protein